MPHVSQVPPFTYEDNTFYGQALGINFKEILFMPAFLNALYAHGADLDDGNSKSAGHIGASVISAVPTKQVPVSSNA